MNFGHALDMLKLGNKVARRGWNGKGMYLALVKSDNYYVLSHPYNGEPSEDGVGLLPWIGMKTADEKFVPWLASQTDMLAEDWVLVK